MAAKGIPGIPLAVIAAGGVSVYSGLFNVGYADILRTVLQGKAPAPGPGVQYATVSSGSAASSVPAGNTGASSGSAAANQAVARLLAAPYGWSTGQEWADLVSLWNRESGWSVTAKNPSSGAYGIPQSLPASKMASAGSDYLTSASTQIRWGLGYIKSTYGSPSAAWAHEQSNGWY